VIQGVYLPDGMYQYQNDGTFDSSGVEFEVRGNVRPWLETVASLSLQRSTSEEQHTPLPNTPSRIAKARGAVPLYRRRLSFSIAAQYLSTRSTDVGASVRPVFLLDTTLVSSHLFSGVDLTFGIRNALNWQYEDPVDVIDEIPANGRSVFVKLTRRQD